MLAGTGPCKMASSKVTVAASSLLVMLSVLLVVLILTKPSLAAGPPAKSGKNLVDQWIKDLEDPNLLDSSDSEGGSEAPSEQDNNPGPVGNATTPDPVDRQTPHGAGGLGPARNPGPAQADDIPNLQDDFAPRRLSLNSPPGGPLQLLAGVAAYGGSLSLANFAEVVPLQPRLPELPLGPLTTQELNAIASPSSNLVTYDQGRRSPLLRAYRKAMAAKVPGEAGAAGGAKRRQSEDSDAHQANTGVDAREELRIAGGFDAWLPFGSAHRSKRASLAMEWINGTNGPAAGARATRPLSNAGRRRVVMEGRDVSSLIGMTVTGKIEMHKMVRSCWSIGGLGSCCQQTQSYKQRSKCRLFKS